jgi:hypothetical protein
MLRFVLLYIILAEGPVYFRNYSPSLVFQNPEVSDLFREKTGMIVREGYGQSETVGYTSLGLPSILGSSSVIRNIQYHFPPRCTQGSPRDRD